MSWTIRALFASVTTFGAFQLPSLGQARIGPSARLPAPLKLAPAITYDGCVDPSGTPVVSIEDASLQNVAVAAIEGGAPVIRYNPNVLDWFHQETRLFWYAHECGHHVLGHAVRNNPLTREKEADCWAVATLVESGLVSDSDLDVIMQDIERVPGDGWVYLPGPQRAMLLGECAAASDSGGADVDCVQVDVPCEHAAHPLGDLVPCTHALHLSDLVPCQHMCVNPYWGVGPCHQADRVPCTHPKHRGDRVPCTHAAHPGGHSRCI